MDYLIDGYNLLFHLSRKEESFQDQREQLIRGLAFLLKNRVEKVLLVFDAAFRNEEAHQLRRLGLAIYFTAFQQTADDYLLELVESSKCPNQLMVITSDRALSRAARQRGACTLSIREFLLFLHKQHVKRKNPPKEVAEFPQAIKKPKTLQDYYEEEFTKRLHGNEEMS